MQENFNENQWYRKNQNNPGFIESYKKYYKGINKPSMFICPTCGAKTLTDWERRKGYHCRFCTRAREE